MSEGSSPAPSEALPALADIQAAAGRLRGQVRRTPLLDCPALDERLGHRLWFKPECLQVTGAFKARGAYNALAWMAERGELPERVVTYSSGNHAQAVAWAACRFGIQASIFMPQDVAEVKRAGTASWGAQVILRASRGEAEVEAEEAGRAEGCALIPPFDHPQVICGQGTATLEAWEDAGPFDAVFVPVGGGGLMSGTTLAAKGLAADSEPPREVVVIGGEPEAADDAVRTLRSGALFRWDSPPETAADGARTLSISPLTWAALLRADGVLPIAEDDMLSWTRTLQQELKLLVEPTSALAMAACEQWLASETEPRRVLVILSGGNLDPARMRQLWG